MTIFIGILLNAILFALLLVVGLTWPWALIISIAVVWIGVILIVDSSDIGVDW